MNDILSFAEKEAKENLSAHHENATAIQREANFLLLVLLSGGGAALAYGAQNLADSTSVVIAAIITSVYLFAVATFVSELCLSFKDYPPAANEPRSYLKIWDKPLETIRKLEMDRLQEAIDITVQNNNDRARWLSWGRRLTAAAPLVAIVAWLMP